MRQLVLICLGLWLGLNAGFSAEGRIIKVLPQFLDKDGKSALTPSLYDRDAYQAILRKTPAKRSAIRYAVQWKAEASADQSLKLRLELRGTVQGDLPQQVTFEFPVRQHHWWSHWAYLVIKEEDYKKLGEITAWRVTLRNADQQIGEQKSFLW